MVEPLSTHRDVIELLGGMTALARDLGLDRAGTTAHWASRGIPRRHRQRITELAAGKGVKITHATWESLVISTVAKAA